MYSWYSGCLLHGVDRNWHQSSILYMIASVTCGEHLLVNSSRFFTYVGNPTLGNFECTMVYTYKCLQIFNIHSYVLNFLHSY